MKRLFIFIATVLVLILSSANCMLAPPSTPTPEHRAVIDSIILQEGNNLPKTELQPKESKELEDNHIGIDRLCYYPTDDFFYSYSDPEPVYSLGLKWLRISADDYHGDPLDWQRVEVEPGSYSIDPAVDNVISDYASNDINIVLNLGVGTGENRPDETRFRSEEDVERYCNYVRFMVNHFKDRVKYYEIWNEPDCDDCIPGGRITSENYANLIKYVVPVIKEEDPEAKIVIGAVGALGEEYPPYGEAIDYLADVLKSGVAPLVDVISWHPFYGIRPDHPYYQNYPQVVENIKELAVSEGFEGEYLAEEIAWTTWLEGDMPNPVSEGVANKYYTRAILMHRGLNVTVSFQGMYLQIANLQDTVHNICDVMAGAEAISLPVEIQCEATNIRSYGFSLPNGDKLLALWTDGVAVDDDPGVDATLTFPGFSAQKVVGIDILHGFEQQMIIDVEDGNLVIHNLLIKDYPIILRIKP